MSVILSEDDIFNYTKEKMKKDLVILSDEVFADFVNLFTEVVTRTRINSETGTVANGALFTEEYLPTETVLYTLTFSSPIFNENKGIFKSDEGKKDYEKVMDYFTKKLPKVIQIGGNSTLGKGIVRTKIYAKEGVK